MALCAPLRLRAPLPRELCVLLLAIVTLLAASAGAVPLALSNASEHSPDEHHRTPSSPEQDTRDQDGCVMLARVSRTGDISFFRECERVLDDEQHDDASSDSDRARLYDSPHHSTTTQPEAPAAASINQEATSSSSTSVSSSPSLDGSTAWNTETVQETMSTSKPIDRAPILNSRPSTDDATSNSLESSASAEKQLGRTPDVESTSFESSSIDLLYPMFTAVPEKSFASGSGLKTTIAGRIGTFQVYPKDKFANDMTTTGLNLLLTHTMSPEHSRFVSECKATYCTVRYVCIEAGEYLLHLRLYGEHILGSPYRVQIIAGPVNATNSIAMGLAQPMARPSISLNHAPSLSPSSSSSSSSTPASIPPPPSPQPTSAVVWLAGDNNTFTINPRDSYGNRAVGFHDQPIRLHYRLLEFDSTCCTSAAHHCQWDDALLAPLNDATMPSPYDHVAVFEPYLRPSHPLDPFVPNPVTLQQGPFSMSLLSDGRVQVTANITTACVFYLHISIGDTSIMSSPFLIRVLASSVYVPNTVVHGSGLSVVSATIPSQPVWVYMNDQFGNSLVSVDRYWRSELIARRMYRWQMPRNPQLARLRPLGTEALRVYCWHDADLGLAPSLGNASNRASHASGLASLVRNQNVAVFSSDGTVRNASSACSSGEILSHHNGTFSFHFTAAVPGTLMLHFVLNGEPLPASPYSVTVRQGYAPAPPTLWQSGCFYTSSISGATSIPIAREQSSTAIGEFLVDRAGQYYLGCFGDIESFGIDTLSDRHRPSQWHTVALSKGPHRLELKLGASARSAGTPDSGRHGVGARNFSCQFIVSSENPRDEDSWTTTDQTLLDVAGSSWFMILQLVVLFQCLQAILG